ncbi:MAG: hypothetical protein ABJB76_08610 [Candidatus Nitrosocosmicus sp.]
MISYDRLSKKPLIFKSFTGLTGYEFDNFYNKEITKSYNKHKISGSTKERVQKENEKQVQAADISS